MPKATWNGVVIADSENCQIVEGNYSEKTKESFCTCTTSSKMKANSEVSNMR